MEVFSGLNVMKTRPFRENDGNRKRKEEVQQETRPSGNSAVAPGSLASCRPYKGFPRPSKAWPSLTSGRWRRDKVLRKGRPTICK